MKTHSHLPWRLFAFMVVIGLLMAGCDNLTDPEIPGDTTVAVTGVTLNKASLTLEAGNSEILIATVAPANASDKDVSWSSSDTGVATVANGKVTAVAAGSATITVKTTDGDKTATCAVTVTAPTPNSIGGGLGNYTFGVDADGTTPVYTQAVWTLTGENLTKVKEKSAQFVLVLSQAPSATMQLIWQGPANNLWWNQADLLGTTGNIVNADAATWYASEKMLVINLAEALDDYSSFTAQTQINIIIAYYGGANINSLGIVSAYIIDDTDEDIILGVAVSPTSVTLDTGDTQTFTAEVFGIGSTLAQTVTWSIVEAGKHAGTTITSGGVLTVSDDETLTALTVRATSTADDTKFGDAKVTVISASSLNEIYSIVISPAEVTIDAGDTYQFGILGYYAVGSQAVEVALPADLATWEITNNVYGGIATISDGLLSVPAGVTTTSIHITATLKTDSTIFAYAYATVIPRPPQTYSFTVTIQPETGSQRVFYDDKNRPVFYKGRTAQFVATVEATGTWPTKDDPATDGSYFEDTPEEIAANLQWDIDRIHNAYMVGQYSSISDDGLFSISRQDTFAHYIEMGGYTYEDPNNRPSATVRASPKLYNAAGQSTPLSPLLPITSGVTTVGIRDLGDNRNDTGRGQGKIQEITSAGAVNLTGLDNNNVYVVKVNATNATIAAGSIGTFSQSSPSPLLSSVASASASLMNNSVQSVSSPQSNNSVVRGSRAVTAVNTKKNFYVETSVGNYTTKEATLLAAGDYGNIWVVDSLITTAKAQELAAAFDIIYPAVTNVFGYEYGGGPSGDGGKDGDTKIQILVQNIPNRIAGTGGATSGLFMEKDYLTGTYSNQAEMFYIDAAYLNDDGSMSILAHEFQHLINYNQKNIAKSISSVAVWFNELLSVTTEDFTQAKLGTPAGFSRVGTDGSSAAIKSLTKWEERIRDYGNAALFGGHLLRNYGGVALFKSIMENDSVDIASLTAALTAKGYSLTDVFNTIAQSMIFTDDIGVPAGAKTYGAKAPETIGTVSYTLSDARQFFDSIFYESMTARALDAYSVEIYSPAEWKGYIGSLSINFTAPSNSNVKVYLMVR